MNKNDSEKIEQLAEQADNYTAACREIIKAALEQGEKGGKILSNIKVVMDYADLLIKFVVDSAHPK